MREVFRNIGGKKILEFVFVVFILIYTLFTYLTLYSTNWKVGNEDNYKDLFKRFLDLGYYDSVAEGTTILYNIALSGIYYLTRDVDKSFFILNSISDLLLLFFGFYFCKKVYGKRDIYFYITVSMYVFYIFNLRSYLRASNDTFLGVFIIMFLYMIIVKIYTSKSQQINFILIGFLLSICLAVRITAVLLIPLLLISLIFWVKITRPSFSIALKLISLIIISFLLCTTLLHFPSLKEHQKLSYEDKNPQTGLTWIQRNYLGLKKIERGEEKIHRDAIWKNTKFEVVEKYIAENGEDSLPRSYFEVVKRDPVLLIKATALNFLSSIFLFIRFWGLSFILLFLSLITNNLFIHEKLSITLLTAYVIILSAVCFTFLEYRWYHGYEVLIPIGTMLLISKKAAYSTFVKTNVVFVTSMVLIMTFNLRSIYNLIVNLTT